MIQAVKRTDNGTGKPFYADLKTIITKVIFFQSSTKLLLVKIWYLSNLLRTFGTGLREHIQRILLLDAP